MGYPVRALGVLVAVIALFLVAKWVAGPAYLGLFDTDRSQNVELWASKPLQYADVDRECASCHGERVETWQKAAHQNVSCESCHGPAESHLSSGVSLAIEEPAELCIRCHAALASRPVSQPQVNVEEHAGPIACTACHNPHQPSLAGPPTVPHSLEGREGWCTVCHGATGVKPFPEDHAGRTSGVCLTCHQSPGYVSPISTPTGPSVEPTQPAGPPIIPHSLEGRSECTACHGLTGFKPFPADHAGRTKEVCLACHNQQ
ncbi:MAG: cytochrome [Dehalococcoidia bacterium]|nr:cytochrome [Dehalococcoidia bacterium]